MRLAGAFGRQYGRENPRPGTLSTTSLALLRVAHKNSLPTMVVQIATAIGMVYLVRGHDAGWYYGWFAIVLVVWLARVGIDRVLAHMLATGHGASSPNLRWWGLAHSLGLTVSAGLWALLAWVRLPIEDSETRFVILIILSALAGGAIGVLAPLRATGRIYITLILVPACLRLLFDGSLQPVLGILGLVFWGVMIAGHRNNHALLVRSIALGEEKLALVEELQARNEEVAQINQSLERRVAERTEALEAMAVKAEAASLAKSAFLATISHEIRTPLNGVLGMVQVMERGDLDDAQRGRLHVVQASARMLLGIVNDVLDISKIEAGKMELNPSAFRIDEFADDIRGLYWVLAQEKGLQFTLSMSGDGLGVRHGDAARLRQIISNLISNALKFTEKGEIRVEISTDDHKISCAVHDTGVGIPPEDQANIFDRFVQADGSNTRRVGGAGLGLAICRELTGLMGGEISFTSTPGVGSCFTVTLPMPLIERAAEVPAALESTATMEGSPRILVVDDNPTNQLVLQTLLEQFGLTWGAASNGREAVSAWEADDWDAILMDINMPVMDGLDATRVIRAMERGGSRGHTPIIAVTASTLSHETEEYRAAGMDDVIAKPIDAGKLVESLSRQLGLAEHAQ